MSSNPSPIATGPTPDEPPAKTVDANPLAVVGIGADGWEGLAPSAREALNTAELIFGADRQLALLPVRLPALRVAWPKPMLPALPQLLAGHRDRRRVVLASGDPTFHGIAATILRLLPEQQLRILPHPSSLSLACARLGWAQADVEVVSLVTDPPATLHPVIQPGRRLLVLAADERSPALVARLLRGRGFGPSRLIALSNLAAPNEQRQESTAAAWPPPALPETDSTGGTGWPTGSRAEPLTVLAVECRPGPDADRLSVVPGLPDAAYENDGQLTKRQVRAITLSSLAPSPGELLWDIGGGAGSIGIEWLRQHPACTAICVERDAERVARIRRNAETLGVPRLDVIIGSAPSALADLPTPDAIFVGGGASNPGMIDTCWRALRPGGRLVANVTTLDSEQAVYTAHERHGGELTRIEITRAAPIGRYTGWRPAMPVTQWVAVKPAEPGPLIEPKPLIESGPLIEPAAPVAKGPSS